MGMASTEMEMNACFMETVKGVRVVNKKMTAHWELASGSMAEEEAGHGIRHEDFQA